MTRILLGLTVAALLAIAPGAATAGDCYQNLDPEETAALLDDGAAGPPLVLDVRTAGEFTSSTGHIEGAVLLPVQDLAARIGELSRFKDREIIVVCRSGNRSVAAAAILCDQGFTRVYNLSGGMNSWTRAGEPVTRAP